MGAKIPEPKRRAVLDRLGRGERMAAIAVSEGVGERTVRRIAAGGRGEVQAIAAAEVDMSRPAGLDEMDLAFLKWVAVKFRTIVCVGCEMRLLIDGRATIGRCIHCEIAWKTE